MAKGLPATSRIKAAVFKKLSEDPPKKKHMSLAEFEAERERFIQSIKERGQSHGSD